MNPADPDAGVYVTVGQLAALRHRARGFSFLPRQPVRSLLAGGHASKLRGRGLDFVAPGVGILSSFPVGFGREGAVSTDTLHDGAVLHYSRTTDGVTGTLVSCGLADTKTSCASPPADQPWIALIRRGKVDFGIKVTNGIYVRMAALVWALDPAGTREGVKA